ncbi:hypothetical protein B0H10DRAFT_772380 [Mycena sp. CBHHK59/15]|nr:hypothetical protein B0H10DRAFT_772380 [Mycena sp. CBHHK59/15]
MDPPSPDYYSHNLSPLKAQPSRPAKIVSPPERSLAGQDTVSVHNTAAQPSSNSDRSDNVPGRLILETSGGLEGVDGRGGVNNAPAYIENSGGLDFVHYHSTAVSVINDQQNDVITPTFFMDAPLRGPGRPRNPFDPNQPVTEKRPVGRPRTKPQPYSGPQHPLILIRGPCETHQLESKFGHD